MKKIAHILSVIFIFSHVLSSAKADCSNIFTVEETPDTIVAGDTYRCNGRKYEKMGYYINIYDTLVSKKGCDSIVKRSLFVLPDPKTTNYFVTERGSGKIDGSTWDNALNNALFAFTMRFAPANTTFHVEVGSYTPWDITLDTREHSLSFNVNNPITIIGGYHESTDKEATIFTGDTDNNGSADTRCILSAYFKSSGEFELSNIVFQNVYSDAQNGCCISASAQNGRTVKAKYHQCTFMNAPIGIYADQSIIDSEFSECSFFNNSLAATAITSSDMSTITFNSCSFHDNNYSLFSNSNANITCKNCTFSNNGYMELPTKFQFYNNTILGGSISIPEKSSGKFVGNIISCDIQKGISSIESKYNILSNSAAYMLQGVVNQSLSDFSLILDCQKNGQATSFNLQNNGGLTSTVALKEEAEALSIRFPISETIVDVDQRGEKRFCRTCIGAFEIPRPLSDTVYIDKVDTIHVGEPYHKEKHSVTGKTQFIEHEKNQCGFDSIVVHSVIVMPSNKNNVYYVCQGKRGTGDGSSWENAMNDTSFAYVLSTLKNAAIFHIAEGIYSPVYETGNRIPEYDYQKKYFVQHPIKLYGGYPSNPSKNEEITADPKRYRTIISGDIAGDDRNGNRQDNSWALLQLSNRAKGFSVLDGLVFIGSTGGKYKDAALRISPEEKDSILITRCTFDSNPKALEISNCNASIDNCHFFNNTKGISSSNGQELNITISSCLFENGEDCLDLSMGNVCIQNSTFLHGNATIEASTARLYNNTILADELKFSNNTKKVVAIGNIFHKISKGTDCSWDAQWNLSHSKGEWADLAEEDFSYILEYDTGEKEFSLFDNGGFTKTIALNSSNLSDGSPILFPLEKTIVERDQRGAKRLPETTIGAYEFGCEAQEYFAENDTIAVGTIFHGKTYDEAGEYELKEKYPNEFGCDSIVYLKLIVRKGTTVPTIFSPDNHNGINDIFMPGHEVFIYNLYGQLICHSTNGWDGSYHGKLAPYGIYIYVIFSQSGETRKGTIELIQTEK